MKLFPAVILGIFVLLASASVLVLAFFSAGQSQSIGRVVIWGTVPASTMEEIFRQVRGTREDFDQVEYRPVAKDALIPQLVESIASGSGPDLVMFPSPYIVREGNKLITIPYDSIPKRAFQDTYLQAGEVFLTATGVKGLPFTIDPLVLYWNRRIFSEASISQPPRYWDEVPAMVPRLTKADAAGTLKSSAIALGSWSNVAYAKGILLSLLRGLGNQVVVTTDSGYTSTLNFTRDTEVATTESALRYYTQFSDPAKPVYSWNRSQPNSRDAFLRETLAMYIAPASELYAIRQANPNLDFDVAEIPKVRGGASTVSAELLALSIPNGSTNPQGALIVAGILSGKEVQDILVTKARLPSVRRDTVLTDSADPFQSIFRQAAISSFSFLDPDPSGSDGVLGRMVEGVLSGKFREEQAVQAANDEMKALLGIRTQ